jgi:hypothetical protein
LGNRLSASPILIRGQALRHSLFKYYDQRIWAEKFLGGEMLFRSLAYFRDCEDAVRGDQHEGTSRFSVLVSENWGGRMSPQLIPSPTAQEETPSRADLPFQ